MPLSRMVVSHAQMERGSCAHMNDVLVDKFRLNRRRQSGTNYASGSQRSFVLFANRSSHQKKSRDRHAGRRHGALSAVDSSARHASSLRARSRVEPRLTQKRPWVAYRSVRTSSRSPRHVPGRFGRGIATARAGAHGLRPTDPNGWPTAPQTQGARSRLGFAS
jgi:hypothetical protein